MLEIVGVFRLKEMTVSIFFFFYFLSENSDFKILVFKVMGFFLCVCEIFNLVA